MKKFALMFAIAIVGCNSRSTSPRVTNPSDTARYRDEPTRPPASNIPTRSELDAILATLVDEVRKAPDDSALAFLKQRAEGVSGIEKVTLSTSAVPLTITFAPLLDAEHVAERLGWSLDHVYIEGLDQHRSLPELVLKAGPQSKSERTEVGNWMFQVVVERHHNEVVGAVPDQQVGKNVVDSGAKINAIRIWRRG